MLVFAQLIRSKFPPSTTIVDADTLVLNLTSKLPTHSRLAPVPTLINDVYVQESKTIVPAVFGSSFLLPTTFM